MQGWTKRPTFGDVVAEVQTDFKVKLPARTAVTFYDSFAMGQFREMAASARDGEEARHDHAELQQAVQTAAQEPGSPTETSRRILTSYLARTRVIWIARTNSYKRQRLRISER